MEILTVLHESGMEYAATGSEDWVSVRCPFHGDDKPSAGINIKTGAFKCHAAGCGRAAKFEEYYAKEQGLEIPAAKMLLAQQFGMGKKDKMIDPSVAHRHANKQIPDDLMRELAKHAITPDLIKRFTLGFDGERITIPIHAAHGGLVNIRKYLPHAKIKMLNHRGYGKIRLYPITQVAKGFDKYVITGGELKALCCLDELNKAGYGVVTTTGGEGNWHPSFSQYFAGKVVYILMDPDEGGRTATQTLGAQLVNVAAALYDVQIPVVNPGDDINDWVYQGNAVVPLLEQAREFEAPYGGGVGWPDEGTACSVPFADALKADRVGTRHALKAQVVAFDEVPYAVPSEVEVSCDKSQDFCGLCRVFADGPKQRVPPESRHIVRMVDASDKAKEEAVKEAVGIPTRCSVCLIKETKLYQVEAMRISPEISLNDSEEGMHRENVEALLIDGFVENNETYEMQGRTYTNPNTQAMMFVFSGAENTVDNLTSYNVQDTQPLLQFQPDEWTVDGMRAKLREIYRDFEANVTHIYLRPDLHLAVDLVYHSPLWFEFNGQLQKGWVEGLVVGDSGQGKTDVARHMLAHYDLGVKVDCKNASTAGLMGGVQRFDRTGKWYVTWGIIPLHDKRLVVLEELKGAKPEVIASLTEMRSSGMATISKIGKRRARARTRLLALSNPRDTRTIADHAYGIESVKNLVGNPEDVRRFDFALVVSESDLSSEAYTAKLKSPPQVDHVYTKQLCRELVLWCWTVEQVVMDDDAREMIYDEARNLADQCRTDIWLIDQSTMPLKLARLAASIAGRTYSATDDGRSIRVRTCHVQFMMSWLRRIYDNRSSGYFAYAKQQYVRQLDEKLVDEVARQTDPNHFIQMMLMVDSFTLNEFRQYFNWDDAIARTIFMQLLQANALKAQRGVFNKTPEFVTWLRKRAGQSNQDLQGEF